MPDTERPALADVIAAAIEYAHQAGHIEHEEITPDDFALQRSPAGWSYATYVGGDFVITAAINPDGEASTDVGYVEWMGSPEDGGDEDEGTAPFVDVYLPGDAPADVKLITAEEYARLIGETAAQAFTEAVSADA